MRLSTIEEYVQHSEKITCKAAPPPAFSASLAQLFYPPSKQQYI